MNEKSKLEEAKYFYSKMLSEQNTRNAFAFNLSAFLSAARSVLQYALKEASQKSGGQGWYDKLMNSSPELKFLKDERDLNIHEKPAHPKAQYILHAETGGYITMFGSISMTVYDKDGNIKQQSQSETNSDAPQITPSKIAPTNPIPNEVKYYFDAWPGKEDILTLGKKCIEAVEYAIEDGIKKGFITG
jgi:hypothetical protein